MTLPLAPGDVDVVVFDFDGVLVDSVDVKTEAFAALYEVDGPSVVEQVVAHHLANGGVSRQRKLAVYEEQFAGRTATPERIEELSARFADLVVERVVAAPAMPHAEEVLAALSDRLPVHVASGTPQDELRAIVHRRGMEDWFTGVHGAPDPKDVLLNRIATEEGTTPQRLLMIGDARTDYEGAIRAGAGFVGYNAPQATFPEGTFELDDLRDLLVVGAQADA